MYKDFTSRLKSGIARDWQKTTVATLPAFIEKMSQAVRLLEDNKELFLEEEMEDMMKYISSFSTSALDKQREIETRKSLNSILESMGYL